MTKPIRILSTRLAPSIMLGTGGFAVVLGLLVLLGWHTYNVHLLQMLPTFAPMQYNAALGLLLCGSGLLALLGGWARLAGLCGVYGVASRAYGMVRSDLLRAETGWADPHQLQQVVVNLLSNAHQAMQAVATPRRLTIATAVDATRRRVQLTVADTGPGIPHDLQQRIFEPFFTTKSPGLGTGLGLSLCQGIVESHGGTINVESALGQGAVFRIELPVEDAPEAVLAPPPVETLATPREGTILVVDDESGITSALEYLLQRDGYQVETAANGRMALEKLRERTYDLLLSDLRMPELDGMGLYEELVRHYPYLLPRLIFLTGDTLNAETTRRLEQVGAPRLSKPFTATEVRCVVQQVLQAL